MPASLTAILAQGNLVRSQMVRGCLVHPKDTDIPSRSLGILMRGESESSHVAFRSTWTK